MVCVTQHSRDMNPKRFHYNTSLLAMNREQPNARDRERIKSYPLDQGYLEVIHG